MIELTIFAFALPSFMGAILVAINYINDEVKARWI